MIFERTIIGLYGQIPVLVNPDIILLAVRASCQAGQNMLQKSLFEIELIPKLLAIRLLRLLV